MPPSTPAPPSAAADAPPSAPAAPPAQPAPPAAEWPAPVPAFSAPPPGQPPLVPQSTAPVPPVVPPGSVPPAVPSGAVPPAVGAAPAKPGRLGWIIAVALLAVGLIAVAVVLILSLIRLDEASNLIRQQQEELEQQEELIEKKETFSAAMGQLMSTVKQFDGTPFGDLIDQRYHESLAQRGWTHRWNPTALDQDTAEVERVTAELADRLALAQSEASGNASGTTYESILDALGRGFVTLAIDDADSLCQSDVLGCVVSDDPYVVHIDAADVDLPWMTDWIRTGLTYHEFAHVLQMTNWAATQTALDAFGGDHETMADCYALTYLDGWSLEHQVWVSDFEYWDVSVGYGYTCDESQRQVVRDWVDSLPFQTQPISQ